MEQAIWVFIPFLIYGLIRLYFSFREGKTPRLYFYLLGASAVMSPFLAPGCMCSEPGIMISGALLYSTIFNVCVATVGLGILMFGKSNPP
jgi:hypothetical protein